MEIPFYVHSLGDAELESLQSVFHSLFLDTGPRVQEFEERFATYLDVPRVVGTSSCSMGLVLALQGLGVGPGDEVVTSPITFAAGANAISLVGAHPVFADVEEDTGLLDPDAVRAALTPRTKAILPVHLHGQLCDMPRLADVAEEHGLAMVEDAAHCVEGDRDGVRPAARSDAAAFSFAATKALTAGHGGAVATPHEDLARRMRRTRLHGLDRDAWSRIGAPYVHPDMVELGWRASLSDVEAALLLPQIPHLDERCEGRRERVARYRAALDGMAGVRLLGRRGRSADHLFPIRVAADHRDEVLRSLEAHGVGVGVHYRSVMEHTWYRDRLGKRPEDCPRAHALGRELLSVPLWPSMPLEDVDRVVETIRTVVGA